MGQFFQYFFSYMIKAKTRQRLLFLAFAGLFLSTFALLCIQGMMGGLQKGVIQRSKNVGGDYVISFINGLDLNGQHLLVEYLKRKDWPYLREFELEMMLRKAGRMIPVIVHALAPHEMIYPFFDQGPVDDLIVPFDIGRRLGLSIGDQVILLSPSHFIQTVGLAPVEGVTYVQDLMTSSVPEVDAFHVWARLGMLQNLIRTTNINRVRIFQKLKYKEIKELEAFLQTNFSGNVILRSWEEENHELAWTLKLETTVMYSLFFSMSFLVSLSIVSGLMIFWNKVKTDLVSFWILGMSQKNVLKNSLLFFFFLALASVVLGLLSGYGFLKVLQSWAPDVFPDIFVERKLPIHLTSQTILLSIIPPLLISGLFIYLGFRSQSKDLNFLEELRN